MTHSIKLLTQIKKGQECICVTMCEGENCKRKLMDMGLVPGERIQVMHNVGHGPITVYVKGVKLALGHGLAEKVRVETL